MSTVFPTDCSPCVTQALFLSASTLFAALCRSTARALLLAIRPTPNTSLIIFSYNLKGSFEEVRVSSLIVCNLREKMSCQTSRERDHGEGQHVEQKHPVHLTCYWSLPSSRGLYKERVMLFTNKNLTLNCSGEQ